ncbi:hypothetical protein IJ670_03615 [bacterium]|nr:hypothetical protein [bacterium]
MKINPINNNVFCQKPTVKKNTPKNVQNQKEYNPLSYGINYYSFLGIGKNLNALYNLNPPLDYPSKDIEKRIEETLAMGNPENKQLCDFHFEHYKPVLDCYSLEELKSLKKADGSVLYPEFQEVNSVHDILVRDKSFIGDYLAGESKVFPTQEDLTLQIIKLYWAKGFSLNMLSNYIANEGLKEGELPANFTPKVSDGKGKNIYHAMKNRLNIPTMKIRYASYLQKSNEQFLEIFCNISAFACVIKRKRCYFF